MRSNGCLFVTVVIDRARIQCTTGVVSADEVFTIIEGENLALFLDNLDEGQ